MLMTSPQLSRESLVHFGVGASRFAVSRSASREKGVDRVLRSCADSVRREEADAAGFPQRRSRKSSRGGCWWNGDLKWIRNYDPTSEDDMTLAEPLLKTGEFGPGDSEWLHLLVGDWQLIADLAQGDLVLWFPEDFQSGDINGRAHGGPALNTGFLGMAHVRPSTAQTVFHRDMVCLL